MNRFDLLFKHNILDKYDVAVITDTVFIFYFTGVNICGGYLAITKNENYLFVDGRYFEIAQKKASCCNVVLLTDDSTSFCEIISENDYKNIVFSEAITVSRLNGFKQKLHGISISTDKYLDGVISQVMSVKDEYEINCITKAQNYTDLAFDYILGKIKPGLTEIELSYELEFFIKMKCGCQLAFDTIFVSGENTSLPHGEPTERVVQKGDLITIDFGARYNGYCSDMTRTIAVGRVDEKKREVYELVLKAQKNCLNNVKSGITGAEADAFARSLIVESGYGDYFNHATGHCVGLNIHESPTASPKEKRLLQPNQVITVEPGVYLPGKFGIRIEDMVIISDDGCINLTKSRKDLVIL